MKERGRKKMNEMKRERSGKKEERKLQEKADDERLRARKTMKKVIYL